MFQTNVKLNLRKRNYQDITRMLPRDREVELKTESLLVTPIELAGLQLFHAQSYFYVLDTPSEISFALMLIQC